MDRMRWVLFGGAIAAVGAVAAWRWMGDDAHTDPPSIVERVRAIARLEALEVHVSKTVTFAPDPKPAGSLAGDVLNWAVWEWNPPEGRAVIAGTARIGLDLDRLDSKAIRESGGLVEIDLPPLVTTFELEPERTEVVRSNLDSAATAELFAKAGRELKMDVERDAALAERAREAARKAIRRVLLQGGAREVKFVGEPTKAT